MNGAQKLAPIYGLVLAGGRSTRMRRDKATIEYRPGETQLDAAMKLLEGRVARAFVSVRADQAGEATRAHHPHIVDRGGLEGPIAGISAAFAEHPAVAWLVLACDLPFLDARTLDTLIAARDVANEATAYRSSHDGLPEPLCAIYEPHAREALAAYLATGKNCPRKFLIGARTRLVDQPNPRALDNVNTVEEYGAAMTMLSNGRATTEGAMPAPAKSASSTTPCCANRPAAAPKPWSRARALRASCTRSSARAIRSRCPPRCCAWRSTPSSASGHSLSHPVMPWFSFPRWPADERAVFSFSTGTARHSGFAARSA